MTQREQWTTYNVPSVPGTSWYGPAKNFGFTARVRLQGQPGETWQARQRQETHLDGYSVQDAIEHLQTAAEGLEDAVVDVGHADEESSYSNISVEGWSAKVTAEQHQRIQDYLGTQQQAKVDKVAAERSQLIQLAAKYPEMVQTLAKPVKPLAPWELELLNGIES